MGAVFATADIGSNTVHLLVADVTGTSIRRIVNESEWLNLGQIVSREGKIPRVASDRLLSVLTKYKNLSVAQGAKKVYVFATEAMRVAQNHDDVLARIKSNTGIKVELISSVREAELSWRGALVDCGGSFPATLVEIGGGSVQVATFSPEGLRSQVSLPLGTGRLLAQVPLEYPIGSFGLGLLQSAIEDQLQLDNLGHRTRLVGSGGVIRGLWRALHPDGERKLDRRELEYLIWSASRLEVGQIAARFNVRLQRAQTLLPGALTLLKIMERLEDDEIIVSEFGVREGAILEASSKKSVKK